LKTLKAKIDYLFFSLGLGTLFGSTPQQPKPNNDAEAAQCRRELEILKRIAWSIGIELCEERGSLILFTGGEKRRLIDGPFASVEISLLQADLVEGRRTLIFNCIKPNGMRVEYRARETVEDGYKTTEIYWLPPVAYAQYVHTWTVVRSLNEEREAQANAINLALAQTMLIGASAASAYLVSQ
jgi:hypothetical protein